MPHYTHTLGPRCTEITTQIRAFATPNRAFTTPNRAFTTPNRALSCVTRRVRLPQDVRSSAPELAVALKLGTRREVGTVTLLGIWKAGESRLAGDRSKVTTGLKAPPPVGQEMVPSLGVSESSAPRGPRRPPARERLVSVGTEHQSPDDPRPCIPCSIQLRIARCDGPIPQSPNPLQFVLP